MVTVALVRHTRPALPTHLPAPGLAEGSGEDYSEDVDDRDDDVQRRWIHLNMMIQNLLMQNTLNRTDHISQSYIDSRMSCNVVTMSSIT